jgi:hypothetical protein
MFECSSTRQVCLVFNKETTGFIIDYFNRPSFVELLEELSGKPYISPIQRSLQLILFNGITPVLDHSLDLTDFRQLDGLYRFIFLVIKSLFLFVS